MAIMTVNGNVPKGRGRGKWQFFVYHRQLTLVRFIAVLASVPTVVSELMFEMLTSHWIFKRKSINSVLHTAGVQNTQWIKNHKYFSSYCIFRWGLCGRKVAGSIPDGVTGNFHGL